jgi:two-component system, OmpR family, copper resistance phosphate regulon response regulator CusR
MGPSILVIESDEATRQLLGSALAVEDFQVAWAATGRLGREVFDPGRFAVVILDAELPDIDGLALLTDLAAAAPSMPIMVLSALDDVTSKVLAFELGATDYLTKPVEVPELVARLRRRAGIVGAPERSRSGRWALLPERRAVDDGTRTVSLSALEWRVLEHLIAHKEAICTRDELVELVWGGATDRRANVVDVCIRRLRRKLGPEAVTTVRGAGYRLG